MAAPRHFRAFWLALFSTVALVATFLDPSSNIQAATAETAIIAVAATDSVFEDKVLVTWPRTSQANTFYRVKRDGLLLSVVASHDSAYSDFGGTPGVVYIYSVAMINVATSDTIDIGSDPGSRVLAPPQAVAASDGTLDSRVRITWSDQSVVEAGYRIYRDGLLIGSTPLNQDSFSDTSAVAGTTYDYCVRTVDAGGNESQPGCDDGWRGFILPPGAVMASDGQHPDHVLITWTDPTTAESGFRIYRNGALLDSTGPNATSYSDFSGTAGVTYDYCVRTVSGGVLESVSACDSGGRGTLAAPGSVTASDLLFDNKVEITWTDPGTTEDGFKVLRDNVLIATTPANATSFTDNAGLPGTTYQYCVVAFSASGGESAPACDAGTRSIVVAPTAVTASDGQFEDRVLVTWESASTSAVLFKVLRDGVGITTVSANVFSWEDFDVASGVTHEYCVRAITAGEMESGSACDDGFRTIKAPTDVTASDAEFESHVLITWNDNSNVESGYQIGRRFFLDTVSPWDTLGTRSANRTSFLDSTAAPGGAYIYRVLAFDDLGISEADTDGGSRFLSAPESVEATDGEFENKILLTWLDQSAAETGYHVYRKIGAGAETLIGTTAKSAMTFKDSTGVVFGTVYTYRVAAFDAHGESEGDSDDGNTAILGPGSVNASDAYPNQVTVSWVDRSAIETGYIVSRDGTPLDTTAANASSFTDNGAVAGTTYSYCVRAVSGATQSADVCDDGGIPAAVITDLDTQVTNRIEATDGQSSGGLGDNFGKAVAFEDDWMLVGAPGVDIADVAGQRGAGAVYAFQRNPDTGAWVEKQKIMPADREGNDNFGDQIAIDGGYAVISAFGDDDQGGSFAGAVYVYKLENGTWVQKQKLTASDSVAGTTFGYRVAISGAWLAASTENLVTPTTYVFSRSGETWTQSAKLTGTVDHGQAQSLDMEGEWLFVGAWAGDLPGMTNAGVTYAYRRSGSTWSLSQTLSASDAEAQENFGTAVDIQGSVAAIGAYREIRGGLQLGAAYIFTLSGSTWTQGAKLIDPDGAEFDGFGRSVTLDGEFVTVGNFDSRVFVYRNEGSGWAEFQRLVPPVHEGNSFGVDLELSGNRLGIGVSSAGFSKGAVFVHDIVLEPGNVTASDGTFENRVRIGWEDRSSNEMGFYVYRDGQLIETLDPNIRSYSDFEGEPGRVYEYCVSAITPTGETRRICDFGRRPPDGAITGRVSTRAGAGVEGVEVCLDPPNLSSVQLDGAEGHVLAPGLFAADLSEFTVEFWARTGDPRTGTPFSYSNASFTNALLVYDTGALALYINDQAWAAGVNIKDNLWHHVAFTWRNSDGAAALYVDGQLRNSTTGFRTGATVAAGGILVLGQDQDTFGGGFQTTQAFQGQLEEVRVWNVRREAADIGASVKEIVDPDSPGLVLYMPLSEGEGSAAADLTPAARYGTLEAGAFWSDEAAPLNVCGITDLEGNYAMSGIRYGASTTFQVTPELGPHQFEPAFKSITLSSGNPVQNEVAFNDISSFTLSGSVLFAGTACPEEGAEVLVDDVVVGTTNAEGNFSVASGFGGHTLKIRRAGRTFSPAVRNLVIEGDQGLLNFEDLTQRTLTGRVGGGCNQPIGTVAYEVRSESGCFVTTGSTDANYEESLAPQKYFVRVTDVTDVPSALDRADILEFFEDLGPQIVDLSEADQVMNLVYRAPLQMVITGFPAPPCSTISLPNNVSIPAVPVLLQGDRVELTIEVYEDYGDGNTCPVDTGTVTIFDEIIDEADTPVTLIIENGQVRYTTAANTPNIFPGRVDVNGNNRSFQKPISAVAEVTGLPALTVTEWVIVDGHKPRTATFTSTTEEVPLVILRDPPGDGSSAFLETGTTICSSINNIFLENIGTGLLSKAKAGVRFSKGTPFWSSETEVALETENKFEIGFEATQDDGVNICATTTERVSTSDGDVTVGDDGDVFMGIALNLIFAKTDVISVQGCQIMKSEAVTMGGTGFKTSYLYSVGHIKGTVIPQLQQLAQLQPNSAGEYLSAVTNWQNHLKLNDSLKAAATFKVNRSFNAGADFEYSQSSDTTGSFAWTTKAYANNELALGFVFNETGSGFSNQFLVKLGFEYTRSESADTTRTRTVGYSLKDDDYGDYFTVDVKDDPKYGTPVFKTLSGRSSCPWELRTQPRDSTLIAVEPPVMFDVPPDESAIFTLALTNASPSEELRECLLIPVQTSNPGGAIIDVNASLFGDGLSFFIGPEQTQEVTMTVSRGPSKYRYDNLQLIFIPPCQFDLFKNGANLILADTLTFSVRFQAPCSDITLFEPKGGWSYNRAQSLATSNNIRLTLKDFSLQLSETDSLESIGADYRLVDTDVWFPIAELPKDSLEDGVSEEILWNVGSVPDGVYELRAWTSCPAGKTYSETATGTMDRRRPGVFGAPQPADSLVSLGDEISISFDEDIKCSSVNAVNVSLVVLNPDQSVDTVQVSTACDGRTVIITPVNPAWPLLEGKKLQARVTGVRDLRDNPMVGPLDAADVVWRMDVRRNVFTWKEISVAKEAPYRNPGSVPATLVNGTQGSVDFTITGLPAWLSAVPPNGTIAAGGSLPVQLVIDPAIAIGANNAPLVYNAVVNANVANPPILSPLAVQVTVICVEPEWVVDPGDFEHSMSVVARLQVGGVNQVDPNDRIAAYVGNQLRGVASPVFQPALNSWLTFITVYSNRASGENVRFQVWDDSDCRLYTGTNKTVRFEADKRQGTTSVPEVLNATDLPPATQQAIGVNSGWTWISFNLLSPVDMTVNGVLGDLNPATGDLVKNQTSFSQFDPATGWVGTLGDFNNTSGYALKVSEAGTIVHEGGPVPVATTNIPVTTGWNWIGYLPQVAQPINTALSLLAPQHGDVIKSQTQFAQYVKSGNIAGWFGDLGTMNPGLGYRLYLSNASIIQNQFRYFAPAAAPGVFTASAGEASAAVGGVETAQVPDGLPVEGPAAGTPLAVLLAPKSLGPGWELNPGDYAMNMTVTAQLAFEGAPLTDERDVVAAMVGDEIRGLAQPQFVPGLNQYLVFLMVYGNEGEQGDVTFRLFAADRSEVVEIANTISYQPDRVVGTVVTPFELEVTGTPGLDPNRPRAFSLARNYPNPPRGTTVIRYDLPNPEHVVLKLYDVVGREILSLVDASQPSGRYEVTLDATKLANGLYFYRLEAGSFRGVQKMMIAN